MYENLLYKYDKTEKENSNHYIESETQSEVENIILVGSTSDNSNPFSDKRFSFWKQVIFPLRIILKFLKIKISFIFLPKYS